MAMYNFRQVVNNIYLSLSKKFQNKPFSFNEIVKESKISTSNDDNSIGNLYNAIVSDARFLYCGNQQWVIASYISSSDRQRIINNGQLIEEDINVSSSEDTDSPISDVVESDEVKPTPSPITVSDDDSDSASDDSSDSSDEE